MIHANTSLSCRKLPNFDRIDGNLNVSLDQSHLTLTKSARPKSNQSALSNSTTGKRALMQVLQPGHERSAIANALREIRTRDLVITKLSS